MAKEAVFVEKGEIINSWTNGTGSDISIGDVVSLDGARVGIAMADIDNTDSGPVQVVGVFNLAADNGNAFVAGEKLWWDTGNEELVNVDGFTATLAADSENTGDADIASTAVTVGSFTLEPEVWTLTVNNATTGGSEVWTVTSDKGRDVADLTTAVAYDNGFFSVTIPAAAGEETGWAVGDVLTITIGGDLVPAGWCFAAKAQTTATADVKIG
jgi:predicted RecA/RadA family phage recombinase